MTALPADLQYGYVVGLFLRGVADTTADPDRLPDKVPASGLVTFSSDPDTVLTTNPSAYVAKDDVVCTIDANGYLLDPAGAQGVWLIAGIWTVSFAMVGFSIAPKPVEVLSTHTLVAPLDLPPAIFTGGDPLTPSEYTLLSGRISAIEGNNPMIASQTQPPIVEGLVWIQY